jgi:hypothetical protein
VTVRRSEWDVSDVGADPEWREDWCAWLARYGIDPQDVCVPGWIEADDDARTLRFPVYVHDEHGRLVLRPHGLGLERTLRTLQLKAPALPFPEAGW